jgi:hypothetical protein
VDQLLRQFGVSETDTPVVAWGRRVLLRNPSNRELAETLGIRRPLDRTVYDLVVVGAGPAGSPPPSTRPPTVSTRLCWSARARAARPAAACA